MSTTIPAVMNYFVLIYYYLLGTNAIKFLILTLLLFLLITYKLYESSTEGIIVNVNLLG